MPTNKKENRIDAKLPRRPNKPAPAQPGPSKHLGGPQRVAVYPNPICPIYPILILQDWFNTNILPRLSYPLSYRIGGYLIGYANRADYPMDWIPTSGRMKLPRNRRAPARRIILRAG